MTLRAMLDVVPWSPPVGGVYRVPDRVTGWSPDKAKLRWGVVVAVNDRISARMLPRSASAEEGVFVTASALGCFTKEGCFVFDPKSIPLADLREAEHGGTLKLADLTAVLDFYYDELSKRRRGRRPPEASAA